MLHKQIGRTVQAQKKDMKHLTAIFFKMCYSLSIPVKDDTELHHTQLQSHLNAQQPNVPSRNSLHPIQTTIYACCKWLSHGLNPEMISAQWNTGWHRQPMVHHKQQWQSLKCCCIPHIKHFDSVVVNYVIQQFHQSNYIDKLYNYDSLKQ